ncbi:MAG: hypothetical protein C6P37_02125 [Caldibacillus debilis]|uniref:Uncharacterized protein n=1 Tax=Caldibacillus debilis TaxID=301148 RepID=A0A3E0K8I4_9BACI|nr:MAG: hypothetical protein C6P37_02125 [Caldibacillus debilis]
MGEKQPPACVGELCGKEENRAVPEGLLSHAPDPTPYGAPISFDSRSRYGGYCRPDQNAGRQDPDPFARTRTGKGFTSRRRRTKVSPGNIPNPQGNGKKSTIYDKNGLQIIFAVLL